MKLPAVVTPLSIYHIQSLICATNTMRFIGIQSQEIQFDKTVHTETKSTILQAETLQNSEEVRVLHQKIPPHKHEPTHNEQSKV